MKTVEIVYRYDADQTPPRARPASAAQARGRLENGNVEFAELIDRLDAGAVGVAQQVVHVDPRELGVRTGGDAPIQRPFAAVLGCADARVPIELVFHEGPNDRFVVRIAGNVLGSDILGSLRYAIDNLADSLRLVVVLGHAGCGAVGTAVIRSSRPAATSTSPRGRICAASSTG
jgi:carbonic anhydrase